MRLTTIGLPALAGLALLAAGLSACTGGSTAAGVAAPAGTTVPQAAAFATIAGAPTALAGTNQALPVPAVPGVPNVGGTLTVTAASPASAVVTVASAASAGTPSGPPVSLQSAFRATKGFGGAAAAPLYYVGVTNTTNTAATVNFSSLALSANVPPGSSVALAHYDPAVPQNGWNQHCAFGGNQVNSNGTTTTFSPNANLTIYPGATLWFAPYTYPSNVAAAPTPPPAATPVVPTPAPAPASLTGTYVGSAQSSGGSKYLEFSLTQSGSNLSGTYAVLPNGSGSNQNGSFGSLSGTVGSGGAVTLSASAQYGGGSCGATTLKATASGMMVSGTFGQTSNGNPNCGGSDSSGTFSAAVQTAALPTVSGNYSGTINDSKNGAGSISFAVSQPGTVFSGTGTVSWPSNPQAGGSSAIVGFVTSATAGFFAVIGNGQNNCNASGTLSISATTLSAQYSGSGDPTTGCTGSGSFTMSH